MLCMLGLGTLVAQEPITHSTLDEEASAMLQEGKPTVAVLDFEGRGITQLEAATLTDRLMSELAKTEAVILVERQQVDEILKEQGFQQSGCTTVECAAEVGALLGVQKMVAGSVGKIGETYTIDAKMFSVETGMTEKTVSKTYTGKVDGLITEIEITAWELVDLEVPDHLLTKQKITTPTVVKKSEGPNWLLWSLAGLVTGAGIYYVLTLPEPGPSTIGEPPAFPNVP
jgi:TolB-like protein